MKINDLFINENYEEIKKILRIENSLNLRALIKLSKEKNYINIISSLCETMPDSVEEVVGFACFYNDLDLLKEMVEVHKFLDFNKRDGYFVRLSVRGGAVDVFNFIINNFHINPKVRGNEILKECILERQNEIFEIVFEHKDIQSDTRLLVGLVILSFEKGAFDILQTISKNDKIKKFATDPKFDLFDDKLKEVLLNIDKIKNF